MKRVFLILLFILHSSSLMLKGPRPPIVKTEEKPPKIIKKQLKKPKKKIKTNEILKQTKKEVHESVEEPTKEVKRPTKEVKKTNEEPKKYKPKYVYYSAEVESIGNLVLNAGHYKKQQNIMFRLGLKFRLPETSLNMEFSSAYEFEDFGLGIIYEKNVFEFKRDPLVVNELGFILETTGRHERYFIKGNNNYISTGYRWDF